MIQKAVRHFQQVRWLPRIGKESNVVHPGTTPVRPYQLIELMQSILKGIAMLREATAMTVRQNLGELLNEVQYRHDEIVITKAGKPVAAMIDIALYKFLKQDSENFEHLWAKFSRGFKDMSEDQVMDEVTAIVKDVRREMALEKLQQRPAAE